MLLRSNFKILTGTLFLYEFLLMLLKFLYGARKAKGLSSEALADLADTDRSYMGGLERGQHNIAILNLLKVVEARTILML